MRVIVVIAAPHFHYGVPTVIVLTSGVFCNLMFVIHYMTLYWKK